MPKTKRKALEAGDVFLVPLEDNSFGTGMFHKHVPRALNSHICTFFSNRFDAPPSEHELALIDLKPIATQFVTRDLLDRKTWKIVGSRKSMIRDRNLPDQPFIKAASFKGCAIIGSGIMRKFLNAYHGLLPWNMMKDDHYFDKLLLPKVLRPPSVIQAPSDSDAPNR